MEYERARRIRNVGLGALIKRRMVQGQGLGAIKSSISDKFTAKVTGIKEKFDPMNWMKYMFFGSKFLTAMAGRAMGRDPDDIEYFTGYTTGRKYRNKYKGKDPKRTTIGPGRVLPLRVGDSEADVLGKIMNFMVKQHDIEVRHYEMEKLFREEQMEEDERRHKRLIDAIKSARKPGEPEQKEKDMTSWFDKLFNLLSPLKGLKNLIGFIMKMGSMIMTLASAFSKLIRNLASMISRVIMQYLGPLLKTILKSVQEYMLGALSKTIDALTTQMESMYDTLQQILSFLDLLMPKGRVKRIALAAGMYGLMGWSQEEQKSKEERDEYVGPKATKIYRQIDAIDMNVLSLKAASMTATPEQQEAFDAEIQNAEESKKRLKAEADKIAKEYQNQILIPTLQSNFGYSYRGQDQNFAYPRPILLKDNQYPTFGELKAAAVVPSGNLIGKFKDISSDLSDIQKSASNVDFVSNFTELLEMENFKIPKQVKRSDVESAEGATVINNTSNVSGGGTNVVDPTPLSSRNPDSTLEICTRNWVSPY